MHKSLSALMLAWVAVLAPFGAAQVGSRRAPQQPAAQRGAQQPIQVLRQLPAPVPRAASPTLVPPGPTSLTITIGNQVLVPTPANNLALLPPPGFAGVQNLSLFVPATGDTELFLLGTPGSPQQPAPLLVAFHIFGSSHGDVLFHTDFFAEAFARGWYVLAPLARSAASDTTANFGERRSIVNASAGFDWVLAHRNIDESRMYGVGFSMGGGTLGSFMTHHLDPEEGMLAAWALHTGSVDQVDTYPFLVGPPDVTYLMDELFGGPPALAAFEYQRASLVQLDGLSHQLIPGGLHMAYNLEYAPGQIWWADQDPLAYLVTQTEQLSVFMTGLPNANVTPMVVSAPTHVWQTMSESDVCTFFDAQTLALPTSGRVVADEDRNCFQFELTLDAPGQFAEFDYVIDTPGNRLALTGSTGVTRIITDTIGLGLSSAQLMRLELEALDFGDEVVIRNFPVAPTSIIRDGIAPPGNGWMYDAPSQTLTINETDIGLHVWEIQ